MIKIDRLDHLVLTVADIAVTRDFYECVLGMKAVTFGEGRWALNFGRQKINLHQAGQEFQPHASAPRAGSGDLCFITETPLVDVVHHLEREGVAVIAGPGPRTGATGPIESVYIRDPDGNLIEISQYR